MTDNEVHIHDIMDMVRAEWDKIETERATKLKEAGTSANMIRRDETLWYELTTSIELTDNNRKRYVIDEIEIRKSIDYRGAGPYVSVRGHGHRLSESTGKPLKKRDYMFLDDTAAKYFG